MLLTGARGQLYRDFMYDASGTITTASTAQLVLPERRSCSFLLLQNISTTVMYVEFGGARATAALTNGVITSITVTNAGFNYTVPPIVDFLGGGNLLANPNYLGPSLPEIPGPSTPGSGIAVLSGGTVGSITITNGGKNYIKPPFVFIKSSEQDPNGVAAASATSGIELAANGAPFILNGTAQTTDAISIFCTAQGAAFTCKWMA